VALDMPDGTGEVTIGGRNQLNCVIDRRTGRTPWQVSDTVVVRESGHAKNVGRRTLERGAASKAACVL